MQPSSTPLASVSVAEGDRLVGMAIEVLLYTPPLAVAMAGLLPAAVAVHRRLTDSDRPPPLPPFGQTLLMFAIAAAAALLGRLGLVAAVGPGAVPAIGIAAAAGLVGIAVAAGWLVRRESWPPRIAVVVITLVSAFVALPIGAAVVLSV